MLIEFTGCTGSGKSTIYREVVNKLYSNKLMMGAINSETRVEYSGRDRFFERISGKNVFKFLNLMPWVALSIYEHRHFLSFALKKTLRCSDSFSSATKIFVSLYVKMGIFEYLRKSLPRDLVVVVDEGVVHSAHNFLVHVESRPTLSDIAKFSELVPLPDVIVHVGAPMEVILERSCARLDRSPRVKDRSDIEKFVRNAHGMFEALMRMERISRRTFSVSYSKNSIELAELLADKIVDHILERKKPCSIY